MQTVIPALVILPAGNTSATVSTPTTCAMLAVNTAILIARLNIVIAILSLTCVTTTAQVECASVITTVSHLASARTEIRNPVQQTLKATSASVMKAVSKSACVMSQQDSVILTKAVIAYVIPIVVPQFAIVTSNRLFATPTV